MAARTQPVGYRWLLSLQTSAVRIGLYTGVGMSGVFVVWLFLANRVPFLERFALERNVAGGASWWSWPWYLFSGFCAIRDACFCRVCWRLRCSVSPTVSFAFS